MKFREHRARLADSMATTIEIEPTLEAVTNAVNISFKGAVRINKERVKLRRFCYDRRIDADVWAVMVDGFGICGFTDSDVVEQSRSEW